MKKLLLLLPLGYLLLLLYSPEKAFTQDLGRHLKLGELILQCQCVPKTNLFSYTHPAFPFVNHHWLPEVLFFLIFTKISPYALLVFKILTIISAFLISLWLAVKKSTVWIATILSFPFIYILSERFDARPEIVSFVCIALFFLLLSRFRDTNKYLFLLPLPLIELLWVNSHIYFFIGPLLFAFLIADFLLRRKITWQLILLFGATVLIMLLNPHGLIGAIYPLTVFGNYGYSIVENQNIFFLNSFFFNPRILIFEIIALVSLVLVLINLRRISVFYLLSFVFVLVSSFYMIRNFPLSVFIAFPIAAEAVCLSLSRARLLLQKQLLITVGVIVMLIVGVQSILFMRSPYFGLRYVYGAESAVKFFKDNNLKGPIFNNFDIGSFLIYSLYPQERVFVDGRPEAYPASFFDEYKRMQTDPVFFKQQVKRYSINTVFFAHTDITPWGQAFMQSIIKNPEWIPVYVDERIVILVRKAPENQHIITKFARKL